MTITAAFTGTTFKSHLPAVVIPPVSMRIVLRAAGHEVVLQQAGDVPVAAGAAS